MQRRYGRTDLLPLWIADMDFATPDFVIDALRKRLEHPVLGYTVDPPELWPSVINWIWSHHQYKVEVDWLSYIPGIVKGIGFVVNVFSKQGDKII
ncbi:MAG TPA: cystathionine beta-lyase, partial [Paludibacteraceae bacterium]|nr:cystathionine beta-lyase [Paludibacteraceae bacterium]